MSTRLFQGVMRQMKDEFDRVVGVLDENSVIVACSELTKIGEVCPALAETMQNAEKLYCLDGYTYRPLTENAESGYVVFVEGEDDYAAKTCALLSISLGNIKSLYDEKYDKASFVKNIILDNILPSDIYIKSKELHFDMEEMHVVFLICFSNPTDTTPYEMLQTLFPDKNTDYIINVSDHEVALVKKVNKNTTNEELEDIARNIADTLSAEFFIKVHIGISTIVHNIKELARAYKESRMSLDVGKVFDTDKSIISYDNLGIGRLIYQLPTTLCEMFLSEVFKNGNLESLDRETLVTIQAFFENNLNVSETSRRLYVHRNTLVYRLEKIQKITGLNLREFDHAITFKVALMVKKYLNSKPNKY